MRSRSLSLFLLRLGLVVLLFVLVAGRCSAQTPFTGPVRFNRDRLAENYLRRQLSRWQHRLRLDEWKVSVEVTAAQELRPSTLGNIRWDAATKTATIRVLHVNGYQGSFATVLKEMESTLVHELIHLTLSSLPRDDASRLSEEQAVDQIAVALLNR